MRAHSKELLAVTTTTDEITNTVKPLFAFPVDVVKATDDDTSPFKRRAPSGAPREQKYVDTATGEIVADADCPTGIELPGDDYRPIDKEAIDQIKAATKIDTMVVLGAIDIDGFREQYGDRITGRYFLQSPAKGGSAGAYKMTYEALRDDRKALVTKRTARSKQKLAVIYADEQNECLSLVELVFAAQVREADAQVKQPVATAEVAQKQIDLVKKIVSGMQNGAQALDTEVDEAVALREELIEKALAGEAVVAPTPIAKTAESDDLMAALEASLK